MSSQIKGLSQFIADLRATTTQEAEKARVQAELTALRKKLQASKASKDSGTKSKNGYEFRKAVSKLLYIYILGYDVELGSDEIAALLRMPRFAEKQIGYLALTLLLHARSDLKGRVESIVYEDLRSSKEVLTSIALNYVSTWDSQEAITEELVDLVFQLMVSPTSSHAVTKKAALTLLNFYRQDPVQFTSRPEWMEWIERISALLSTKDLGVSTSVTSLLTEIAKREPQSIPPATFRRVVRNLNDMFDDPGSPSTPSDYVYYSMSAPWLVSKLCNLLTYLPNTVEGPQSQDEAQEARDCISNILSTCMADGADITDGPGAQQHINARNMVFFAAVRLGNHFGMTQWGHSLSSAVLSELEQALKERETNTRYLALESLRTFPMLPKSSNTEGDLIGVVLQLVKDRDISVRRQALDTLYKLCDSSNVERVSAELLDMMVASDLQIRPQMVSRLAALIERFATSHAWYFDTCISLLLIGGVYVGDEVWQRLVQVVVNNEPLQGYAVDHIYETLTASNERSRRYSDSLVKVAAFILGEFGSRFKGDVLSLLVVLQDCIGGAPWSTKVMLLTAYIKFAAHFPHTRPQIADAVAMYENSPDLETQQRACEYTRLLRPENAALLTEVIEEMPPYGEQSSLQLFQKLGDQKTGLPPPLQPQPTALVANGTGSSTMRNVVLSSNWEFGFRRMLTHSSAVLYQDALLQVGCRYEFRQHLGCVMLYLTNISSFELTSVTAHITNPMDNEVLSIRVQNQPPSSLAPGKTAEQVILCEAKQPFALTPTCRITYLAGSFAEMSFKLPIVLERFMSPSAITTEQFAQRWEQVGAASEFSKTFHNFSASKASRGVEEDPPVLTGLQYGLVPVASPLLAGAGILHTSKAGMFGCLVQLEPDATHSNYKVTVRATKKKLVAVVLANNLSQAYQL